MKKRLSLILSMVFVFTIVLSSVVSAETVYKVKKNDVLWKIADKYDMDWEELAQYNDLDNPHLIYEGQELKIPDANNTDETVTSVNATEITILGTSDLHGRIYSYEYAIDSEDKDAGLAKIQTLVKAEKAANKNVILMDMGDTVQDNSAELFNDRSVHPMVEAMNYMDYDIWTIGNHEFNFEKSFLEKNINAFEGDVLSANIYKVDGSYFVDPYTIIEKDGVRVAIVGLIPPHVPVWEASSPEHFEGLTFAGTVESAKKAVKDLEGKYDVLVGSFHLGQEGEHGYEGAAAVAEACPEFNVIFMGHAHAKINDVEVNGVKLIEPGKYGWALAKASIKVEKISGKWMVQEVATSNLETYEVEQDADILAKFEDVHEASRKDADTVVGTVTEDYIENVDFITGEAAVTTMPTSQMEDTALIDLINDVQMLYTKSEISSAAAFKNDMNLVTGDFKKKDVANIYKYPNTLIGVNITGKNLKAYMEWSASYYNTYRAGDITISFDPNIRGYNYDMFSGVTYDIDISKPAGSRITNLLLNGQEIKDDSRYKLAVNNYRFGTLLSLDLVKPEDKYYDSYSEMQDAGRIRDLIIKYIQEEKGGKATPTVDNNWKVIGADLEHPRKAEIMDMIKSGELEIPRSEDGRTPNVKSINIYELIKDGVIKDAKTVTLLHTNDMHGFFAEGKYDGMGAAKLATFFKQMKEKNSNTLVLDAGDAIQGHSLVTLSKGENAMKVLNALNYDAMALGNHEFDYGKEKLVEHMGEAQFAMLAANVKDENGKVFAKDYIIKEMDGVKVGIFGLCTPETTYKSHPDNTVGLTFENPVETAKAMVKTLEGKVDVVVAVAHLGDEGETTSTLVAESVDGIDVIVDGHSHSKYSAGKMVKDTLIVSSGEKTKNIGVVELMVKDGSIVSKGAYLFTKNEAKDLEEDSQVKALIDTLKAENAKIAEEVVAVAPYALDGEKANSRTSETQLGNLITASLLDISGADIALQNGGGIRASIDAGDITKGEILTVLPFGNTVRVIEVTGADVKAMMENALDAYPEPKGAFAHIGGMLVEFDSSKKAGNRVVSITIGDKALEEGKIYTLATNDYLVAGGDGYKMFKNKKVVAEYGALDEVLIDYVTREGFDASKITGRIKDVAKEKTAALIMFWYNAA